MCLQVASFLRNQHDQLDKAHLGELLGHHEDFAIAIMHAWIDSEPSMTSQAIDQALRRLLGGFRLPGEAQKIDRIMEKFAEVRIGVSEAVSGPGKLQTYKLRPLTVQASSATGCVLCFMMRLIYNQNRFFCKAQSHVEALLPSLLMMGIILPSCCSRAILL